jgi:hypothetical protein
VRRKVVTVWVCVIVLVVEYNVLCYCTVIHCLYWLSALLVILTKWFVSTRFPGAHWGYTAKEMAAGFDGRSVPIKTLSDLRRELKDLPPNDVFTRNDLNTER